MPGFSFSPTMIDQHITLILKGGKEIDGIVKEVNPAEIVLQHPSEDRLIRLNRDSVDGYSGFDNVKRSPDPLRLHITRCYNISTRCNGVKLLTIDPGSLKDMKGCPVKNELCECFSADFFEVQKSAQIKLLKGLQIGEFPEYADKKEEEKV